MPTFVYLTASGDDKILIFRQDEDSGALENLGEVEAKGRPAPMATDPECHFLYVARRDANKLDSYSIDPATGGLELMGVANLASDPNFLATDKTGRWLLSAYYLAGRCAVHPIDENGVVQSPPVEWRATGQGAHSMQTDASNRFAFVPHIGGGNGVNAIFQFILDESTGTLTSERSADRPAGRGPRSEALLLPSVAGRSLFLQRTGLQRYGIQLRPGRGNTVGISDSSNAALALEWQKLVRSDSDKSVGDDAVRSEQGT